MQVAMVELQLEKDDKVPEALLVVFAVCTTLLVTVHLVALMISTCILPNMEAISSGEGAASIHGVQAVNESPHDKMRLCVEMAWVCSTGLGIILFLVEIGILCWVKFFERSQNAAIASTVIVIPAGVLFVIFSLVFYRKLMAHKYELHEEGLRELEDLAHALSNDNETHRLNVVWNFISLLQPLCGILSGLHFKVVLFS